MAAGQIDPGVGYRLLEKREMVVVGDQFYYRSSDNWNNTSNTGQLVGERGCTGPYRRKVEVPTPAPQPVPVVDDGWIMRGEDEIIQKGDSVCPEWALGRKDGWEPANGVIGSTPSKCRYKVRYKQPAPPPEMTQELYDSLTPKQQVDYMRPAFEALLKRQPIEYLSGSSGEWLETLNITSGMPHRPKVVAALVWIEKKGGQGNTQYRSECGKYIVKQIVAHNKVFWTDDEVALFTTAEECKDYCQMQANENS